MIVAAKETCAEKINLCETIGHLACSPQKMRTFGVILIADLKARQKKKENDFKWFSLVDRCDGYYCFLIWGVNATFGVTMNSVYETASRKYIFKEIKKTLTQ